MTPSFVPLVDTDHFTPDVAKRAAEALAKDVSIALMRLDADAVGEIALAIGRHRPLLFARSTHFPAAGNPFHTFIHQMDMAMAVLRQAPLLDKPVAAFLADERMLDLVRTLDCESELARDAHDVTDPLLHKLTELGLAVGNDVTVIATPKVTLTLKLYALHAAIAKAWAEYERTA